MNLQLLIWVLGTIGLVATSPIENRDVATTGDGTAAGGRAAHYTNEQLGRLADYNSML